MSLPPGRPNRCPVCKKELKMFPATTSGNIACRHCGAPLRYFDWRPGYTYFLHSPYGDTPVFEVGSSKLISDVSERPPDHGILETLHVGDRVRITIGTFEDAEGTVTEIDLPRRLIQLAIEIFGRSVPVEVESWQIERVAA